MDILESLENTIILSNYSLYNLNEQNEIITNIEKQNSTITTNLSISEHIINSLHSFYNKLKLKTIYLNPFSYSNTISNPENTSKTTSKTTNKTTSKTTSKTTNIEIDYKTDVLNKIKQIKENNSLMSTEIDTQNYKLEQININIYNNNNTFKKLNKQI